MNRIPIFQNEFLGDVADSLRKRSKSISRMASRVEGQKVYEQIGGKQKEKLEIHLETDASVRSPGIRIYVWEDRSLWIDARELAKKGVKGWAWSWTNEGRLVGGSTGRDIISALEKSANCLYRMDSSQTFQFDDIWNPMLAKGPFEVR